MRLNELLILAAKKYGYSYTLNEKGLFVTHGQGHGKHKQSVGSYPPGDPDSGRPLRGPDP